MALLGVLGWTGIARVVRGQVLSLREQEFLLAAEATGIRVSRKILRHLLPSVMPLLIVQATINLGEIILTEATLSFLGLGVKYPLASWGSIVNAATDVHVMTNYWFVWIPAGVLIVLTVLGFKFCRGRANGRIRPPQETVGRAMLWFNRTQPKISLPPASAKARVRARAEKRLLRQLERQNRTAGTRKRPPAKRRCRQARPRAGD